MKNYINCCGLNINRVSLTELLFNKVMLIAYVLIAIGLVGWYELFHLRYFHEFVSQANIYAMAGNEDALRHAAHALKEQIFNLHEIEEVNKADPWGVFVTQYVYLLYGGSALIFLTSLAELFKVKIAPKVAAAMITFGISMVFGGLISIATDLGNLLNIYWMFLNPQPQSGMWLMLPLYTIYIPFTFIEIYFLITNKRDLARKVAGILVILGILIDLGEFYIQGLLFNLNTPRHLWTDIPQLWIYFLITGGITGIAGSIIFAFLGLRNKPYFEEYINFAAKVGVILTVLAAIYEIINFMVVDPKWMNLLIKGSPISWMYWGWLILGIVVPFVLFLSRNKGGILIGAISALIGTFLMRQAFIYGGNIVPMTERVDGLGPQSTTTYVDVTPWAYIPPHTMEILIIIGCLGLGIAIYAILDKLFDVRNVTDSYDHH
jgi:Ni/Fe-hydrogenase subunit HybB-like protein